MEVREAFVCAQELLVAQQTSNSSATRSQNILMILKAKEGLARLSDFSNGPGDEAINLLSMHRFAWGPHAKCGTRKKLGTPRMSMMQVVWSISI